MAEGPYRIRKHCPDEWEVYGPAVPSHYGSKSAVTYGRNRQNAIHAAARREAIEECVKVVQRAIRITDNVPDALAIAECDLHTLLNKEPA